MGHEWSPENVRAMAEKIETIRSAARELKELGQGLPAVQANADHLLAQARVLRFEISDLIMVLDD